MALKEQDRARKRLKAAILDPGTSHTSAAYVGLVSLYVDCGQPTVNSARLADMVNTVLASSSTVDPVTRARALGDLLAAYGIGTIVAGPIG